MPDSESFAAVEQAIGHTFADRALLRAAFVHRSYTAENSGTESYERLEFLGDAVLQLVVTDRIFRSFPEMPEGEMAKVRAAVVNETALAEVATLWHVGDALILGRGEALTGGAAKPSILSDVVESILGALYCDAGLAVVTDLIHRYWDELIEERALSPGKRDYKTRLQERLALDGLRPVYKVEESGPEHAKDFKAAVYGGSRLLGTGVGTSKKRAEQAAAAAAAAVLRSEDDA